MKELEEGLKKLQELYPEHPVSVDCEYSSWGLHKPEYSAYIGSRKGIEESVICQGKANLSDAINEVIQLKEKGGLDNQIDEKVTDQTSTN